jgi:hypothetical protein
LHSSTPDSHLAQTGRVRGRLKVAVGECLPLVSMCAFAMSSWDSVSATLHLERASFAGQYHVGGHVLMVLRAKNPRVGQDCLVTCARRSQLQQAPRGSYFNGAQGSRQRAMAAQAPDRRALAQQQVGPIPDSPVSSVAFFPWSILKVKHHAQGMCGPAREFTFHCFGMRVVVVERTGHSGRDSGEVGPPATDGSAQCKGPCYKRSGWPDEFSATAVFRLSSGMGRRHSKAELLLGAGEEKN